CGTVVVSGALTSAPTNWLMPTSRSVIVRRSRPPAASSRTLYRIGSTVRPGAARLTSVKALRSVLHWTSTAGGASVLFVFFAAIEASFRLGVGVRGRQHGQDILAQARKQAPDHLAVLHMVFGQPGLRVVEVLG